MAGSAVVEVGVNVRVFVKVEAEDATEVELSKFLADRHGELTAAVERIARATHFYVNIGDLDDERSVYATQVTTAEVADDPSVEVVR